MKSILSFMVMKYLAYSHTISRCYYRRFIILIFILPSDILGSYKEWIFPFIQLLVCIAATGPNLCNLPQPLPFNSKLTTLNSKLIISAPPP